MGGGGGWVGNTNNHYHSSLNWVVLELSWVESWSTLSISRFYLDTHINQDFYQNQDKDRGQVIGQDLDQDFDQDFGHNLVRSLFLQLTHP